MKPKHLFALLIPIASLAVAAASADDANTVDPAYRHASRAAFEKWRDLKFGLRIHWGVYTLKGIEASWPLLKMSNARRAEYQELYKQFTPAHFNADQWMKWFKRWGFTCFAFTSRRAMQWTARGPIPTAMPA